VTFTCTHKLTSPGTYRNVASITGTPEDGPPITPTSNEVEVKVKENTSNNGNNGNTSTTTTTNTSTTTTTPNIAPAAPPAPLIGISPFKAAKAPSLLGPQGCVRGAFTAKLKSKGVASVVFYLDGHRVAHFTAKAARRGYLTIRINVSRLKIGRHKLMAKIVMTTATSAAAGAKPVHATRSLTFVRCASAAVKPKFTG
jgi:hypothetical protein